MLEACLPFGPCVTSKLTFCPSLSVLKPLIWIAEKCANKSSPPSSGVMNPYPLASLNHFTVPVGIEPSCLNRGTSPTQLCLYFYAAEQHAPEHRMEDKHREAFYAFWEATSSTRRGVNSLFYRHVCGRRTDRRQA